MLLTLTAFWLLVLAGATRAERRRRYLAKSADAWWLDGTGLLIQGAVVPVLEITLLLAGLRTLVPGLQASLHLPGDDFSSGFALNVLLVDYLYYWNHRLLHTPRLWPLHLVHHTLRDMDVVGTSRNTAWTSFLILYVWLNSIMLFVLAEPAGYAAGAALTASLDLWRHSELGPAPGSRLARSLGRVLVLPCHHAWHHARELARGNYGANFSLWDRLHGTWIERDHAPARLGVPTALPLWRQLWWPFA